MAIKYGIDFPFRDSQIGDFVKMTETPEREVRANLIHLLLTKKGSRYFLPDFGTRIYEYIFDQNDMVTFNLIEEEIRDGVKKYIPNLDINSTDIENIPKILGSLTGVSVIDGGAEFAIGDILDISGNGRSGKARVVNTISDDGKVNFELISPGSGYSRTTIPIIYPRVILTLSSGNNNISSGQLLYQADNLANGIVYTNSTNEVVIKEISSGFTIGSSIKTALLMNIGKLANTVNNIAVGDVISQYNGATKIANGIIGAIVGMVTYRGCSGWRHSACH